MALDSLPAVPAIEGVLVDPVRDLCEAIHTFLLDTMSGAIHWKHQVDAVLVRGGVIPAADLEVLVDQAWRTWGMTEELKGVLITLCLQASGRERSEVPAT
jgi:hypothetical protein